MYQMKMFRPAIAMIELIFAIVVMGIALLSVPNLLSVSSGSSLMILQQEAIAMAASHTNALMTYAWDEQNTDSVGLYVTNKLTVSASGDTDLNNEATALQFPGARRRTFAPVAITASAIGVDVNDSNDDVDDFNNINTSIIEAILGGASNASNEGEYIDVNITQTTSVAYGQDTATYNAAAGVFTFNQPFANAAPASTTNIKLINTELTSNATAVELQEKDIVFNAFMCNIGANNPIIQGPF